MTVVRNEFERGENSPQSILRERVEATAFLWHNYGKSTIGSKDDLEHVPVARPAASITNTTGPIMRCWCSPVAWTKPRRFSSSPKPSASSRVRRNQLSRLTPSSRRRMGNGSWSFAASVSGQEVILAYHGPAAAHPDSMALQVLAGIMNGASGGGRGGRGGRGGGGGGENEGRLAKALVDAKLAQSANMGERALHDPGLITLTASLNKDQSLDAAKKAMIDALAGVINNPPTKEEVDRVRTGLLRGLERNLGNPQQIATGALNEAIAQGDWRLMFLQHDRLEDISPSDVLRVAQAYFKESNLTVGYYIPDSAPDRTVVPATPNLESLLGNYKSGVTIVHAEVFDPSPANIESRLSRTKLANGMKVVILPKKNRKQQRRWNDRVAFRRRQHAQGPNSGRRLRKRSNHARRHEEAHSRRDSGRATQARCDRERRRWRRRRWTRRARRTGRWRRRGGLEPQRYHCGAANNFVAALRIAAEIMREPAYPPESDSKPCAPAHQDPGTGANGADSARGGDLAAPLSPWVKGDVLYDATREEQIVELKKLTYADVKKFHDQFYGANSGVFAVVGPVDAPAIQKVAGELFGDWNTSMTYRPIAAEYKKVPAINVKIETPDKANAQFEASERFAMSDNDPDYPAMLLAAYMFGARSPRTSPIEFATAKA